MLLSISKQVSAIVTLDEVLEVLVEILTRETGAERGSLFLSDPETGELLTRMWMVERSHHTLNAYVKSF